MYGWFDIKSGVKQGCSMLGFLFPLIIDWIMRQTTTENNTSIRWKMATTDFADGIALLSGTKD